LNCNPGCCSWHTLFAASCLSFLLVAAAAAASFCLRCASSPNPLLDPALPFYQAAFDSISLCFCLLPPRRRFMHLLQLLFTRLLPLLLHKLLFLVVLLPLPPPSTSFLASPPLAMCTSFLSLPFCISLRLAGPTALA